MGRLIKDERGIEGLPMRLIIIVVIAVAVLAVVLAMMKYVTVEKSMTAICLETDSAGDSRVVGGDGFLVKVKSEGMEEMDNIRFKAKIKVTDSDGKPVSGASVVIDGARTAASGITDGDGLVEITIRDVFLPENQDEIYFRIKATAKGYKDYTNNEGILLKRVKP